MLGLIEDYDGEMIIDGNKVTKNKEIIRKRYFTYVFQYPRLIHYQTGLENILMPLKNLHEKPDMDFLYMMANKMDITNQLDKQITKCSGGEQQRLSILRALITKRPIIG